MVDIQGYREADIENFRKCPLLFRLTVLWALADVRPTVQ